MSYFIPNDDFNIEIFTKTDIKYEVTNKYLPVQNKVFVISIYHNNVLTDIIYNMNIRSTSNVLILISLFELQGSQSQILILHIRLCILKLSQLFYGIHHNYNSPYIIFLDLRYLSRSSKHQMGINTWKLNHFLIYRKHLKISKFLNTNHSNIALDTFFFTLYFTKNLELFLVLN